MNRIDAKFEELRARGRKALIPFITAGDPDYETTERLTAELVENGADFIELGVPFSDPIAEGPVIQEASLRSLQGGTTLKGIFEMVRRIREQTEIPLLLMMYVNTIFRFGTEKFFGLCRECGVDGVIVPDLPVEEQDEIRPAARKYGVHTISLVAPTSHERIERIASESEGFLYCVSSTGVTGTRKEFTTDFDSFFASIKRYAKAPCCVGFGISSPEQAKKMGGYCDGVIVGSAIVQIIGKEKSNAPKPVGLFVKSLRDALDG